MLKSLMVRETTQPPGTNKFWDYNVADQQVPNMVKTLNEQFDLSPVILKAGLRSIGDLLQLGGKLISLLVAEALRQQLIQSGNYQEISEIIVPEWGIVQGKGFLTRHSSKQADWFSPEAGLKGPESSTTFYQEPAPIHPNSRNLIIDICCGFMRVTGGSWPENIPEGIIPDSVFAPTNDMPWSIVFSQDSEDIMCNHGATDTEVEASKTLRDALIQALKNMPINFNLQIEVIFDFDTKNLYILQIRPTPGQIYAVKKSFNESITLEEPQKGQTFVSPIINGKFAIQGLLQVLGIPALVRGNKNIQSSILVIPNCKDNLKACLELWTHWNKRPDQGPAAIISNLAIGPNTKHAMDKHSPIYLTAKQLGLSTGRDSPLYPWNAHIPWIALTQEQIQTITNTTAHKAVLTSNGIYGQLVLKNI